MRMIKIIIGFDFGIEEFLSYPCHMCVIQSACVFLVSSPYLFSKMLRRMSGHQTGKHLFFLLDHYGSSKQKEEEEKNLRHILYVFKKETLVPKQEYTCNR